MRDFENWPSKEAGRESEYFKLDAIDRIVDHRDEPRFDASEQWSCCIMVNAQDEAIDLGRENKLFLK